VQKLHGTYKKHINSIQKYGLKLPTEFERQEEGAEGELSFGKAIYLSSYSSKAACYGDEVILVCDVVLGRVKVLNKTSTNLDS